MHKVGIAIKENIGLGDALQFSSLPENYFKSTGRKLVDIDRPWFFDFNPFVVRNEKPDRVLQLWNFRPTQFQWPKPRPTRAQVYLNNAEIWASVLGVSVSLNRPRLYQYEDFPFEKRSMILLHTQGVSHGDMPEHVIHHVYKKYHKTNQLFLIGPTSAKARNLGLVKLPTPTLWDLAALISKSRMLIGMDSGPSWVAACFPDVIVKKIRTKPIPEKFREWIPLEINNIHSHWDDRCHQIFNPTREDIGFTSSYLRI